MIHLTATQQHSQKSKIIVMKRLIATQAQKKLIEDYDDNSSISVPSSDEETEEDSAAPALSEVIRKVRVLSIFFSIQ